ncbi:MAG: hypothetical protein WBW33_01030, partial [Bryobacteraceae bacterium]
IRQPDCLQTPPAPYSNHLGDRFSALVDPGFELGLRAVEDAYRLLSPPPAPVSLNRSSICRQF